MDPTTIAQFVAAWQQDWNSHDLEAMLAHYSDDVVFTSPVARQIPGYEDGVVRGKDDLRRYWAEGLRRIPDLRFEVIDHYVGVDTLVINYRNQRGGRVCEVLTFDGDIVCRGHGTYLDEANPAGLDEANAGGRTR